MNQLIVCEVSELNCSTSNIFTMEFLTIGNMTFCRRELCAAAAPFAQKFTPDLTGVKKNGIINSENGKAIKAMIGRTVSYSVVSKVVKKLTKSTIPKFRGLFSKFFTLIRKAIWKVTGYYISNGLKTKIMNILKKLTNILTKYRIDLVVDIIFCLCSAGGWIALTIDIIDGNLNGRCRLW